MDHRLIFTLLSFLLVPFAFLIVSRGAIVPVTLILALIYTPLSNITDYSDLYIQILMGSLSVATVLYFLVNKDKTLLLYSWRTSSNFTKLTIISMFLCLTIATINTLFQEVSVAAGTAWVMLIWVIPLLSMYDKRKSFYIKKSYLCKINILSLFLLIFIRTIISVDGHFEFPMGLLPLCFLGIALDKNNNSLEGILFVIFFFFSIFILLYFCPDSQSIHVGTYLGIIYILCYKLFLYIRIETPFRFGHIISVLIIVAGPIMAMVFYYRSSLGTLGDILSFFVKIVGESEINLMDRPARWEVLIHSIMIEPIRFRYTNFSDLIYTNYANIENPAYPHNILLAMGIYLGIPGMLLLLSLIIILLKLGNVAIKIAPRIKQTGLAFGASGTLILVLFRNMWSTKVFFEPVEITLSTIAVMTLLHIKNYKYYERISIKPYSPGWRGK